MFGCVTLLEVEIENVWSENAPKYFEEVHQDQPSQAFVTQPPIAEFKIATRLTARYET